MVLSHRTVVGSDESLVYFLHLPVRTVTLRAARGGLGVYEDEGQRRPQVWSQ